MSLDWQYDRRIGNGPWGSGFGYLYLGPISQPPLVPTVGMTDRVTGTVYWLYWDGADHLELSTTRSAASQNFYTFQPYDGPYIGGMLLGVSNGHLVLGGGNPGNQTTHPIFAPNFNQPLAQSYPEPTNYPAPGIPNIPGIPSSTPPPTGGGYAAFLSAYASNDPPLVIVQPTPGDPTPYHLYFYGAA